MKIVDSLTIRQSHSTLEGLGQEEIGLALAVQHKLSSIESPGISWRMDTAETGLIAALRGQRCDVLVIEHARFREYAVLITARPHGTVLQVSWMLVASPRLRSDIRRAVQIHAEPGERFEIGAELNPIEHMDLQAFIGITRLALKDAIRRLSDKDQPEPDEMDL